MRNTSKFKKIVLFGEVTWERNICPLRTQYIFTWRNGQVYVNITSSNGIRTSHHICRFLHISLILKIKLNTGQTPGTTIEGKETNMAKSEGRALLTVETLKTFYFYRDSMMEDEPNPFFYYTREAGNYSNSFTSFLN